MCIRDSVEGVHRIAFDDGVGVLFDPAEMVASESHEVGAAVDKPHLVFALPVDAVLRVVAVHDSDIVAFHVVQVAGGKWTATTRSTASTGCANTKWGLSLIHI